MFEDGSWKPGVYNFMASTHHHNYQIFYILMIETKSKVTNFHLPAFKHPTFYFSSFSLISFAIGLSRTLSSSLGFS